MTGGILQVVAKGTEDVYLTGDPNITFFKTVYRRHTNFSRAELDINFTNKLDFGKEGYCRLEHYGDLVHRLFLRIILPKIQLSFKSLTVGEVQRLLETYNIIWIPDPPVDPLSKFTRTQYENEVKPLILQEQVILANDIKTINTFLTELSPPPNTGSLYWKFWKIKNPQYNDTTIIGSTGATDASSRYLDDVIYDFFSRDKFNLQYKIIDAHYKDIVNFDNNIVPTPLQLPLANSITIQSLMLDEFIKYAISDRIYPPTLPSGYNDNNLEFLYNVDTANYAVSGSVSQLDSNTLFRSGIATAYGSDTTYTQLDAYKIFDATLNTSNSVITSVSDIQNIKSILMDNIRYGLVKNIKMLNNIYNSLNNDSRFIFYRKFPVITVGSNTYDVNSSFTNQSLISNPPAALNDNYTSDFTLAPEPGQPTSVNHPMTAFVNTTVNNLHIQNRDLFRDVKFSAYFNDIFRLWAITDVLTNPNTPILSTTPPPNMYYMNYLWFNMNQDIPEAIKTYLSTPGKHLGLSSIISSFYTYLSGVRTTILNVIKPKITYVDPQPYTNYDIMSTLDATVKSATGAGGDIILMAIIRPGILNTLIQTGPTTFITIPEYINNTYLSALNSFKSTLSGALLTSYINALPILNSIVGLFMTPYDAIPTYSTYQTQNDNIYADPALQINNQTGAPLGTVYSDVQCSLWNYMFLQFIQNYNDAYNQLLLGYTYYKDNIGLELLSYLTFISNNFLSFAIGPIPPGSPFDYYRNVENYVTKLPINSTIAAYIGQYLNNKILSYQDYLAFYDTNRPLLDMRNIIVPRNTYYFEKFKTIVDYLTNIIETTPSGKLDSNGNPILLYNHSFHKSKSNPSPPGADIVLVTQTVLNNKSVQYTKPRNNAIDITLIMQDIANSFFTTAGVPPALVNPYNQTTDPHKYHLWNQSVLLMFDTAAEIKKFNNPRPSDPSDTLFDWLYKSPGESSTSPDGAAALFNFLLQIDVLYNGFMIESDVYKFMKDYTIQRSILADLPDLLGPMVIDTWTNIYNYYTLQLQQNMELQSRIAGTNGNIGLTNILERSLNTNVNANFAWIRRIGHYIINQIWIKIDDQIVDKQFGEWLEIWHSLSKKIKKDPGYNTLIGDINELYTFNNKIKNEYELLIPLQFWFCRNIGSALPLLGLHNADVRLYVNLKSFNEVAYYDDLTTFRRKPKLKCSVLAEYIYVEDDERNKLATSKLEYLIDVLQYNGDIEITNESFNEEGYIEAITRFKNPCKEFFWILQDTTYIDGSLPKHERRWDLYSYYLDGTLNPAKQAKIKFNGRDREIFKDIEFYNNAYPYERHYSDSNVGVNIYSFSLNPESPQPEGSANLSKIDDTSILMNLKDIPMQDMKDGLVKFRWAIYAFTINILRIFSGLGGLVFQQ